MSYYRAACFPESALSRAGPCLAALLALVPVGCGRDTASPAPASAAPEPTPAAPALTIFDESITVGRQKRAFRLVVPKSVTPSSPAPLVVAFHGLAGDGKDVMPRYTRLDELAAEKGFLLVYPEADGQLWGVVPERVKADLAFFDALLARLGTRYQIDPDRVYVLGVSNGGAFAHLVGAERSKVVAAVCSHSGTLGPQAAAGIKAERKFPVMIVHGDQDKAVPVEEARENRDRYRAAGHEVNYVEVAGLGHAWAANEKIGERIWAFFASHPRR